MQNSPRSHISWTKRTRNKKPIFEALRYLTAGICAYEVFTVLVDVEELPTFSRLSTRYHWIEPLLLSALAIHLSWPMEA